MVLTFFGLYAVLSYGSRPGSNRLSPLWIIAANISVSVVILDRGRKKTPVTLSALHTVYWWVRLMTAPTLDRNSGGPNILNSYIMSQCQLPFFYADSTGNQIKHNFCINNIMKLFLWNPQSEPLVSSWRSLLLLTCCVVKLLGNNQATQNPVATDKWSPQTAFWFVSWRSC